MHSDPVQQAFLELAGAASDPRLARILDWLSQVPAQDPVAELDALYEHLTGLAGAPVGPDQYRCLLDLLQGRAETACAALKPRLAEAPLPLRAELRRTAKKLMDAHGLIAGAYQRILIESLQRAAPTRRHSPAANAGLALRSVAQRLEIAAMIASPAPPGLWHQAHAIHRLVQGRPAKAEIEPGRAADPDHLYRAILALAIVQPERLTAQELVFAVDYISRFAPVVELGDTAHADSYQKSYWVDTQGDAAPCAVMRRAPPQKPGLLMISCMRLGTLAGEQLRWLDSGVAPDKLHLSPYAAEPRHRGLLQRLQECWSEPRARLLHRRRNSYAVRACVGLNAVWNLLTEGGGSAQAARLSEWTVLNESPTGYALYRVSGDVEGLSNGAVIALRAAPDKPWDVCLVRWMYVDEQEHIELGVQVLSSCARPVQVVFRDPQKREAPHPALLLPVIPALRANEAVVAPAGCCSSRRFVMVVEGDRTRVLQGRLISLDLRTSAVDLFQYQTDPYPI